MVKTVFRLSAPKDLNPILEQLSFRQTINADRIKIVVDYAIENAADLYDKYYHCRGGSYDMPSALLFNAFLELSFSDERIGHFFSRKTQEDTIYLNHYYGGHKVSKEILNNIKLHLSTDIKNTRTCKDVLNAFGELTRAAWLKIHGDPSERPSGTLNHL